MSFAIFINGVFDDVLREIIAAQSAKPGLVCYLQPYSPNYMRRLRDALPSVANPIDIYFSTTDDLGTIKYRGRVVGWEDKPRLSIERLEVLNQHISQHQPGEEEIYRYNPGGKLCANLISVLEVEKFSTQIPVGALIKVSNGTPVKVRPMAGGLSYVRRLPKWVGSAETLIKDELDQELEIGILESATQSQSSRIERLSNAPRLPERVQILSVGYRRNPDVIIEVLNRANGVCEICGEEAPFLRASDGTPYLEVHHIKTLASGGEDVVENALALCPNCHRKEHFGKPGSGNREGDN